MGTLYLQVGALQEPRKHSLLCTSSISFFPSNRTLRGTDIRDIWRILFQKLPPFSFVNSAVVKDSRYWHILSHSFYKPPRARTHKKQALRNTAPPRFRGPSHKFSWDRVCHFHELRVGLRQTCDHSSLFITRATHPLCRLRVTEPICQMALTYMPWCSAELKLFVAS